MIMKEVTIDFIMWIITAFPLESYQMTTALCSSRKVFNYISANCSSSNFTAMVHLPLSSTAAGSSSGEFGS